ncbi:dTDP-4-dehydrorhamnose reductase [Paenibacillus sp. UNC496MF]|uniref:dTDP-4-dehydrorhamnose reductase n=1 Tax=Paenibacillus sp. UNC496MF TaxID=1502753 RepID=UPI0008F2D0FB|nr:dTDP-4-dehydrorhamnose reductase [Paenibacillus sp. UNC496MF]SFI88660.1 dTDP-4-dehydrorhamnose reductase [Paenibacillus sp. UNC496MF]
MAKLTVVVTGAQGQLGRDMAELLQAQGHDVHGFGRQELDITDPAQAEARLAAIRPDAIVHAAAYTKVDQAETDREEARRVNGEGARILAVVAERIGAKLVYVSTDYVFNGQGTHPYEEQEPTDPINEYGRSKLAGEEAVKQHCSRFFVVRTSWVYGAHGQNFVKTMLKLAEDRSELGVVNDQFGCPTFTKDLAAVIAELVQTEKYGVYHVSNSGSCSWHEFAVAIFELAGKTHVKVNPISSSEFPRPAKRPAYSVFAHKALADNGFGPMRHWKEALADYFAERRVGVN